MSRKDFAAIAQVIAAIVDKRERARVAELVGNVCAAHNGQFDQQRFYLACGVAP
jgi:hypothetical protein